MMPTSPPQEIEVHSIQSGKDDVVADNSNTLSTTVNNSSSPAPPPPLQQGNTPQARQLAEYSSWTGLCGCMSNMRLCCFVLWCPCIAFGRIVEIIDKGASSCCACGSFCLYVGCILSGIYRGKLKRSLNIRPNCPEDFCCHIWCDPCALCQEYRELENRGYDLSLGWEENMIESNPQDFWPPVAPTMDR